MDTHHLLGRSYFRLQAIQQSFYLGIHLLDQQVTLSPFVLLLLSGLLSLFYLVRLEVGVMLCGEFIPHLTQCHQSIPLRQSDRYPECAEVFQ